MSDKKLIALKIENDSIHDYAGNEWQNYNNGVSVSEDLSPLGGKCLNFNGGYLYLPVSRKFDIGIGDFTLAFWVKLSSSSQAFATILNGGRWCTGAYNRLSLSCYSDFKPNIINDGTVGYCRAKTSIQDAWHHVAFTRKDLIARIFIDGILEAEYDMSGCILTSDLTTSPTAYYDFGKNGTGLGNELNGDNDALSIGLFDDICLFKKALWTEDFTPPKTYLSTFAPTLYLVERERERERERCTAL